MIKFLNTATQQEQVDFHARNFMVFDSFEDLRKKQLDKMQQLALEQKFLERKQKFKYAAEFL